MAKGDQNETVKGEKFPSAAKKEGKTFLQSASGERAPRREK